MEALLAEDLVAWNDANGEYPAARVPVVGRNKVARFHANVVRELPPRLEIRLLNGMPTSVGEYEPEGSLPPRFVTIPVLGPEGRVKATHTVLASRKLRAVAPVRAAGAPRAP